MKKIAFFSLVFILTGCFAATHIARTEKFKKPDIKDDFCGVQINFQYCKCAFHKEYCEAVGMSKGAANSYVNEQYEAWISELRETFETNCTSAGGYFDDDVCNYCDEGYIVNQQQCVAADSVTEVFTPDGPLTVDCTVKVEEFNRDWKKYSDIDEVIPFEERSYEAKQALIVYESMVEKMIRAFELERDIEIEGESQAILQEYKTALVQNIKTNLLKAFWRLSWVTYSTVQSGTSAGESFSNLLTTGAAVETIGSGLKVIQATIPSDSSLAIDTNSITGKVKSVGASVALEAVDSLGDPIKVATELFKASANAPLPSADISQAEIDILKKQHLDNGAVDVALAESQALVTSWTTELSTLETEIANLQSQVDEWEVKEKERVQQNLEDSCQRQKTDFEKR